MKWFSWLYNKTIAWSEHRYAPYYLAVVSFAESSFFPIPPDVMLVSMGLAKSERAWRYAFIATVCSIIGGLFGYAIGYYGIDIIYQYLSFFHYEVQYAKVVEWFSCYGIWIVFLAGFSPVPYKIFTIAAGALKMPLLPFLLASIISRGLRFYMVSTAIYFYGEKIHNHLHKYIDRLGWLFVIVFVIVFITIKGFY